MTTDYTSTIGLEIHAELKTKTKMFCGCKNAPHEEIPNTHICPICMGHPGTLSVINKEAVRHVLLVGRALGARLATFTEFDRKHYFYPDIPKGYQISQYAYPFVTGGSLASVQITRVHLEEDTARLLHDKADGSLVDFNRAGVPLMELVTEPVMHDAKTARTFARELQLLLRALGASDANMEKGEMRVEVNISLSNSDALGTKVEIKNLNSFRSVEAAIACEIKRQTTLLEEGGKVVQETRGWNEPREETVSQRKKESSHDYRYFPDPDLPKLNVGSIPEFSISRLDEVMPETPSKKRIKFENLGLARNIVDILVTNPEVADFYEKALKELHLLKDDVGGEDRQKMANYATSDLLGYASQHPEVSLAAASPKLFAKLVCMVITGAINSRVAKDMLPSAAFEGKDPEIVASEGGLLQQDSKTDLRIVINGVLKAHPDVVTAYTGGKQSSIQFLIGQGMKATKGSANPALLKELFEETLHALP